MRKNIQWGPIILYFYSIQVCFGTSFAVILTELKTKGV